MDDRIRIILDPARGEYEEKRSRFLADLRPVRSEEEAAAIVEEHRKTYWDARHHCHAFILGFDRPVSRCSDDGEPPQTAGRPMLDVLTGEGLRNVCVVVTRYFGGTLLGTGGLVRAYSQAVKEAVAAARVYDRETGRSLTVQASYTDLGRVQYLLETRKIPVLETAYEEDVKFKCIVPRGEEGLLTALRDATGGRAGLVSGDEVFYVREGREVIFIS